MTLVKLTAAAAIFAASSLPAFAQTVGSPTQSAVSTSVTVAPPAQVSATTVAAYRNDDPLRGLYDQKPLVAQCAAQTPMGPLPTASRGTLAPGYENLMDFNFVGDCRKPF